MSSTRPTLQWNFVGQLPYEDAWRWQKELRTARIAKEIPDTLLLLEHPATITLGRLRGEESLRLSSDELEEKGVTVIRSDRGGDATLHAPGQLVGYLIVDIEERKLTLPQFVEAIAHPFIQTLDKHGIPARYDPKYPGVWHQENKLVAFGFHIKQGVTMHGFAFNLHTQLELFDLIVPCGLAHKGVSSLHSLRNESPETPESIAPTIAQGIAESLNLHPTQTTLHPPPTTA